MVQSNKKTESIFYEESATPVITPVKTPIRKGAIFAVSLLDFCHGLAVTSVFAYLPKFVKELGFSDVELGTKTGILASSMFLSMMFSSPIWGYICDNWGRKLSVYLCAGGLALTTLMFGFSYTYTWAVFSRASQGLFLGILGIAKVIITDVSDDSNLGAGMSFMLASYSLGLVVGPGMAGFLAFPAEKYPHLFKKGSYISSLKILMPNLIISVCIFVAIIFTALFVPENIQKTKDNKKIIFETPLSNSEQFKSNKFGFLKPNANFINLFRYYEFLLVLIFYGLQALNIKGYEELFPVHAATELSYCGYGMSESAIGTVFFVIASVQIVMQLTIISITMEKIGAKMMLCTSTLGFGILIVFLPTVRMFKHKVAFWMSMCIHQILIRLMMSAGYLAINVQLNNSVDSSLLGTANGLAMSITALGRAVGPTIYGISYSWSLKNVEDTLKGNKSLGFPFNEYFAFLLIGLSSFFLFLLGLRIPKRFNKRKINAEENPLIIKAS